MSAQRENKTLKFKLVTIEDSILRAKKNEARLKVARERLDDAARVAHDICSPLTMLNALIYKSDPSTDYHLMLVESVKRISDLTRQLAKMSKDPLEANESVGIFQFHKQVNLTQLLRLIVAQKRLEYESDGVEFIESWGDEDVFVHVDQSDLMSVLSNILNNAVEAIVPLFGRIEIQLVVKDSCATVRVKDTGRGIPSGMLNHIGVKGCSFGKQNSNTSGAGIGIYNAKRFMDSIGGSLQIESTQGAGTEVRLTIPGATSTSADTSQFYGARLAEPRG